MSGLYNSSYQKQCTDPGQSRAAKFNQCSRNICSLDHLGFLLLQKNTLKSTERRHSNSGTRPASKTFRITQSVCRDSCDQKIKTGFYNNLLRSWSTTFKQPMIFNSGPSDKFPFSDQRTSPNKQQSHQGHEHCESKSSVFFFCTCPFLLEQAKPELLITLFTMRYALSVTVLLTLF